MDVRSVNAALGVTISPQPIIVPARTATAAKMTRITNTTAHDRFIETLSPLYSHSPTLIIGDEIIPSTWD